MKTTFPRLERAGLVEVPKLVNGRPSYVWKQGWCVKYSEARESTPETYANAIALLADAKRAKVTN